MIGVKHVKIPSCCSLVLATALVSCLVIVLDISIVIAALPKIHDGFGYSAAGLSCVQNAYTIAFGGLIVLGAAMFAALFLVARMKPHDQREVR